MTMICTLKALRAMAAFGESCAEIELPVGPPVVGPHDQLRCGHDAGVMRRTFDN